jgi:Protein of unknown function (DUF3086)
MNSEDFNVLPPQTAESEEALADPFSFDDLWDDRPDVSSPPPEPSDALEPVGDRETESLRGEIEELARQKQILNAEILALKADKERLIAEEIGDIKAHIDQMVREGVKELESRKQTLEVSIEQLERRRESIRQEMRTSFAGASQDLAIRLQGFKDYLVGSLQDLAAAAEQLELPRSSSETASNRPSLSSEIASPRSSRPPENEIRERSTRSYRQEENERPSRSSSESRPYRSGEDFSRPNRDYEPKSGRSNRAEGESSKANSGDRGFLEQKPRIQALLDRYRTRPDYYGPPWQLRRTFEPIHAERVQQWFFKQGGRGAIRGMGSRLQNILVAAATMSVLAELQGDRFRSLVLANSPERLGEWRRGLQDCLGISRSDFGPDRGVVLFESPEALIQKADRLIDEGFSPLIVIDDTEERLNFALLQFPYWLAFTPDPQQGSSYWY